MAINYNLDNRLSVLNKLSGEYHQWFSSVIQSGVFEGKPPEAPNALAEWLRSVSITSFNIDGKYSDQRERLLDQQYKLIEMSGGVCSSLDSEKLSTFSRAFNIFIRNLQSFCQNIVLEEWGLDVLTGLKNNTSVKADLAIEMERLSREGAPFCLGLVRIDDFEKIEATLGPEQGSNIIKTVSELIKQSLRSYDDAYRVSRDHFILCLKQSDINGGQKGLERLRDIMEKSREVYALDGNEHLISVSCCVAALLPDDNIEDLIDSLYVDLDGQIKDHGSVLTHQEMSPLQRFIQKDKE